MIRRYTPGDESACLVVLASNVPTYFVPADVDEFRQFLRNPCGEFFVALIRGEVLACGGCYVGADGTGRLTWGMVHAAEHRRGVGTALLRHRLAVLRRVPGTTGVKLNTTQVVAPFFERFGFRTSDRIENGYGPGLDKCAMSLRWTASPAESAAGE